MNPLHYHADRRLEARIADLLRQLQLLSEAESTSVVNFNRHAAKHESKEPKGAFRNRGPDPDEGLLTWFLWRLEKLSKGSPAALNALCAEGEVRLAKRLKKQPGRIAGAMFKGELESPPERDRRIAEDYVGLEPQEVRVIESERSGFVSEANIRLVRIRAKREPESGQKIPEGVPLTYEAKKQAAIDMKTEHPSLSVTEIALQLGVARPTVSGWFNRPNGSKGVPDGERAA